MRKKFIVKLIFYFFCMPWRLFPTLWECGECKHNVAFKQPVCGWCGLVIGWESEKEYEHF